MFAAENGYVDVVQMLIGAQADLTVQDAVGRKTALMYAAANGHVAVVQALLKSVSADRVSEVVNCTNDEGNTALMYAAAKGHQEVVEVLLKDHANIQAADKQGKTALMYAIENGHADVVNLLLDNGVSDQINAGSSPIQTALMYAAQKGPHKVVQALLDRAAASQDASNAVNEYKKTALNLATENNRFETVAFLLTQEEDKKVINQYLEWSVLQRNLDITKLLLTKEPDQDVINECLIEAVTDNNLKMVSLLLTRVEDEEVIKSSQEQAVKDGSVKIAKLLLDKLNNLNNSSFLEVPKHSGKEEDQANPSDSNKAPSFLQKLWDILKSLWRSVFQSQEPTATDARNSFKNGSGECSVSTEMPSSTDLPRVSDSLIKVQINPKTPTENIKDRAGNYSNNTKADERTGRASIKY